MNEPTHGEPNASAPDGMDCNEFVEVVTDYLEEALVRTERLRVDAHLAGCDGCEAYLEQMQRTVEILRRLASRDI